MQSLLVSNPASSSRLAVPRHAPETAECPHQWPPEVSLDYWFVMMLNSYRVSGGLARAPEVAALLKRSGGSDVAPLASWIDKREVLSFEWQSQTWLPLFQFNRFDMAPQPELGQVIAELTPVYCSWGLANWFAQPNPWLADCTPADTFGCDLPAVLNASRADRFIANG